MQALKKAAPIPIESPITPNTPKSVLFSSDEEYRTASEGGRRESGDWSELPPSPPLNRYLIYRINVLFYAALNNRISDWHCV